MDAILRVVQAGSPIGDVTLPILQGLKEEDARKFQVTAGLILQLFRTICTRHAAQEKLRLQSYVSQLNKFRSKSSRDKFYILKRLVETFELPGFSPESQRLFQEAIEFLESRIDFFCSYTTRGLPACNNAYKLAIYEQFGNTATIAENWGAINYLAKMIVYFLNLHQFNGFFDRNDLVNGDLIREKIFYYCERATVFVQLAEQETFVGMDDPYNWCYNEYVKYRDTCNHRYIFYKHEVLTPPLAGDDEIRDWYDFVDTPQGVASQRIPTHWNNLQIQSAVNEDAKVILNERSAQFQKLFSKML